MVGSVICGTVSCRTAVANSSGLPSWFRFLFSRKVLQGQVFWSFCSVIQAVIECKSRSNFLFD